MRILLAGLGLALTTAGVAQPAPVFEYAGLAPAYGVAETVAFQAVNVVPLAVTFCGSIIQRERLGGVWEDANTLTCDVPPPDEGQLAAVGHARHNVRLQPDYFRSMLAAGGPGRFRVVLGAADASGRSLPEAARAAPPFYMDEPSSTTVAHVDPAALGRLPNEAYVFYAALPGFRAIAAGTRADG